MTIATPRARHCKERGFASDSLFRCIGKAISIALRELFIVYKFLVEFMNSATMCFTHKGALL